MAYDALRTIMPIAGWPEERAREVEITGGADPVLPTPFRIGAAGAAALAATGLAAADLWELRGGRRQEVSVDLRQAAQTGSQRWIAGASAKIRAPTLRTILLAPSRATSFSITPCLALRSTAGLARKFLSSADSA